jgi:hypothetical protein
LSIPKNKKVGKKLKKGLIAKVVLGIFCCANLACAAADPFSDVPAKHWAYDAVSKLVKAGIITGNSDGTFRGDRSMTRYEMAQIVANAMTKSDKADVENKALITKLSTEFADELNSLGKRVESLEKKQSPLKFDGFFKYRYEHVDNPRVNSNTTAGKVTTRNEFWLNVQNQFDGNTYFEGSLQNESASGNGGYLYLKKAFIAYKAGETEIAAGRFFPTLGKGTLLSTPFMDGARVSFGNDVKVTLYAMNFSPDAQTTRVEGLDVNYIAADIQFNLSKATNMSLSYLYSKDKPIAAIGQTMYNSTAVGIESKVSPDFTLTGEYAINKSEWAKAQSGLNNPYAYYLRAKYKGANPFAKGSTGFWVQYKKAVPGFDFLANACPMDWNAVYNWTAGSGGGMADDIKGFEYAFETTLAPRLMFTAAYNDLKSVKDSSNQKFFVAQMLYLF